MLNKSVPVIFLPRMLRSRVCYANLRTHKFSAEEYIWLCCELNKTNGVWDLQVTSLKSIAARYELSPDGLRLFLRWYKEGFLFEGTKLCNREEEGPVGRIGIRKILRFVRDFVVDEHAEELASLVREVCTDTDRRRAAREWIERLRS